MSAVPFGTKGLQDIGHIEVMNWLVFSWAKSQRPFAFQVQFLPFVTFKHWNNEIMKFMELCIDMIKCILSLSKDLGKGLD
jgi:hypothetical protein